MGFSFASLGSKETEKVILADIEELFTSASSNKLKPLYLTVGPLFMDITSVQALLQDLSITDWHLEMLQNPTLLKESIALKKLYLYNHCDKSEGLLDIDVERNNLKIYFDPDEPYISLICSVTKNLKGTKKSKDIKKSDDVVIDEDNLRILQFKEDEILVHLKTILENQ